MAYTPVPSVEQADQVDDEILNAAMLLVSRSLHMAQGRIILVSQNGEKKALNTQTADILFGGVSD